MSNAVRTFNVDTQLPEELTEARRWICWQYRAKGDGKATKVPVDPVKLRALSQWESNPARWYSYEDAVALYQANPALSGIGLVLGDGLGLIGLDLDDAFDEGGVADWAAAHVRDFNTYTEVSPSGAGLRMFALGKLPDNVPHNVKPREIYSSGRWLTITGNVWNDAPIASNDGAVDRYIEAMREAKAERPAAAGSGSAATGNAELVAAVLAGTELHDATRNLAFRMVDDGTAPAKVVEWLRGIMLSSAARTSEPSRWQERFDDIPRLVRDAEAKLSAKTEVAAGDPNWGFVSAAEMTANLGPTRWLVQGLVPEDCTLVLYGPSGSLKSFAMLDMGLSITCGLPWQGKPTKRRSVYYLAGEGKQGFAKRIAAWCGARSVRAPQNFHFRAIPRLQDDAIVDRLLDVIEALSAGNDPPGLIVIDTLFTALNGGEENSGKDMGTLISAMVRIREKTGAAIAAVHHTGKQGDTTRGHSSLPSGVDVLIYAKPGPTPLTVELTNPKQKDDAQHAAILLQATVREISVIGEDGRPETSLVLDNPSSAVLASYSERERKSEETAARSLAARQAEEEAKAAIKAFALERMSAGATLEVAEREVEDLARQLGFPKLAKKKTTLSEWRKQAAIA